MSEDTGINFSCPHCSQSLEAESDMAGQMIDCPACQKTISIPTPQPAKRQLSLRDRPSPNRQAPPTQSKTLSCKYCGAQHAADAVFCVGCGRNLRTGKPIQTRAETSHRNAPPSQPIISTGAVMLLLVLAGGGYFVWQHMKTPTTPSINPTAANQPNGSQPAPQQTGTATCQPEPSSPPPQQEPAKQQMNPVQQFEGYLRSFVASYNDQSEEVTSYLVEANAGGLRREKPKETPAKKGYWNKQINVMYNFDGVTRTDNDTKYCLEPKYDIRKTDSLVSPLVATLTFTEAINRVIRYKPAHQSGGNGTEITIPKKYTIHFGFQDGNWAITGGTYDWWMFDGTRETSAVTTDFVEELKARMQ